MENGEERDELQKRALFEAFGDSSESDDEIGIDRSIFSSDQESGRAVWEMIDRIKGLCICRNFLSQSLQSSLLSVIQREGWFADCNHNQAMRFGDLPQWSSELTRLVRLAVCCGEISPTVGTTLSAGDNCAEENCPLPPELLWREPLFDQLIVNVYNPGEGICAHVDLMRFEDGIAIVSLESECVMHFSLSHQESGNIEAQGEESSSLKVPILLNPGSLVLMSGESRYLWKHEINRRPGFQCWEGIEIQQLKRTSVTLRKLGKSPN